MAKELEAHPRRLNFNSGARAGPPKTP